MSFKKKVKAFQQGLARRALYTVTWIIRKMSYKGMQRLAKIVFAMGFPFLIRQKKIAKASLYTAFGKEKSQEEIDQIFHQCFVNMSTGMVELMYFMEHPEWITKMAYFEGKEYLDEAFRQGNGAIIVSAHFGNFPLMLLRCVQEGYTTNAIIRQTRDQQIEKYFQSLRTRLGLNTIYALPRKECVDESIKVLRKNQLLFIPLDQNFGSGRGVFVDFFGRKAATATGPVVLSRRTKAPILPTFVVRQSDNTHKIIIENPLEIEEKENDKETVQANIAKLTQIIEKYIREYPQEWGWMHRRWKTESEGAAT